VSVDDEDVGEHEAERDGDDAREAAGYDETRCFELVP